VATPAYFEVPATCDHIRPGETDWANAGPTCNFAIEFSCSRTPVITIEPPTISAMTSLLELYCFKPWVLISTREPEFAVLIVEPVMDPPWRVNDPAVMSTIVAPRLLYCFSPFCVSSTPEPLDAVRIARKSV